MIQKVLDLLLSRKSQIKVILMALFYCVISFQFFINIDGFNPFYLKTFPITHRYIGLGIILINLLLSIIYDYIQKFNFGDKLKAIFQINLTSIFAFLYYTINTKQYLFTISNVRVDSSIILVPLIVLIFFTIQNILNKKPNNNFIFLSNVLLIYLSIFFVDAILKQDSTLFRGINNAWFSALFAVKPEVWTILGTVLLSIQTAFWLNIKTTKEFVVQSIVLLFINLQTIYVLQSVSLSSFGFWHKALFMLIFWDIFYYLFKILNKTTMSDNLTLRINLSLFYHLFLFFALIVISYI